MPENPLDDTPRRQHRIRERAYHLWEADGRPEGREAEYWLRAEALVGIEQNPDAGQLPNPIAQGATPGAPIVEEAAIQDNLGEFPGQLTDQGDVTPTPKPRRTRKRTTKT